MVSTSPPTSKFSSPFNIPLVTVPKAPITIGIIVTYVFHSFFNSLARSRYLSFFSHSFSFFLWSAGTAKSTILQFLFFYNYNKVRSFRVFHWSLSDRKSPQDSRSRLRILAVLSHAVIWIVSTRSPTSKSSRPFNNPLVTVPKVPITIGINVTSMFHSFFHPLARSRYLSFFSHSFSFILWSAGTAKSTIFQFLCFCWLLLGLFVLPSLVIRVLWLLLFYLLRVFHISVSWWFSADVWVTASLLKSSGLFSVFWPISTV